MNDNDKLEEVTAAFTKALIQNKFDDPRKYAELFDRVEVLISNEVNWKFTYEEMQTLLSYWGASVN